MKRPARGLATLAVVMGLLLVSLLATLHLGRSLVLEQLTARNQLAASQAEAAAEAGLDWALAMLAAGRVDEHCEPTTDPAQAPLRDRVLRQASGGAVMAAGTAVTCAWGDARWQCRCPVANGATAAPSAAPAPTTHADGPAPAFRVFAEDLPGGPHGVVRLRSVGCTVADPSCLSRPGVAPMLEARAVRSQVVALAPVLAVTPLAAVTVRGAVQADDATLRAVQPDGSRSALAVVAGGHASGTGLQVVGPPGTPPEEASRSNAAGVPADPDRFATAFLAIWPDDWRRQPAVLPVACSPQCDDAMLRTLALAHPGRPLWLRGPARIAGALGSDGEPLMLMADGPVEFESGAMVGVLWLREGTVRALGRSTLRGALIAEQGLTAAGGGELTVRHDAPVLEQLRIGRGSWTRVPGGWIDE